MTTGAAFEFEIPIDCPYPKKLLEFELFVLAGNGVGPLKGAATLSPVAGKVVEEFVVL